MQQVRIDFDNPGLPQSLGVVEGESQSRIFQATLYKSGAAYTAPAGAVYSIMYRGFGPQNQGWYDTIEDGAGKRAACTVSGNVVTCELARQALRVPGHLTVVLCVSDAKGYMLKSWPIMANVRNDGYEDTGEIEMYFNLSGLAGNYLTQLEKAMADAEATKNNLISTSTQAQKDIDAKAAETLKTIPESYTELDGSVKQLKEDLTNKSNRDFNFFGNKLITNIYISNSVTKRELLKVNLKSGSVCDILITFNSPTTKNSYLFLLDGDGNSIISNGGQQIPAGSTSKSVTVNINSDYTDAYVALTCSEALVISSLNVSSSICELKSIKEDIVLLKNKDVVLLTPSNGNIVSVENENNRISYPSIYYADKVVYNTNASRWCGIEVVVQKPPIASMIFVRAKRDVGNDKPIRIIFFDSNNTKIGAENWSTTNEISCVVPNGTEYCRVTIVACWNTALGANTLVTFSDVCVKYGDIVDLQNKIDGVGTHKYIGEKIRIERDDSESHKCNIITWKHIDDSSETYNAYLNQSMAIFDGIVFMFNEHGSGFAIDYETKEIISSFVVENVYANHLNSAQFTNMYYEDTDDYPLLLISKCGDDHDDSCQIFRITRTDNNFTFSLINKISADFTSYGISWGIDNSTNTIYASTNKNGDYHVTTNNPIVYYGWNMPNIESIKNGTEIVLNSSDRVFNIETDFSIYQGMCVKSGVIFHLVQTYDNGVNRPFVWCVDTVRGKISSIIPLLGLYEPEGISVYDGKLYISQKSGNLLDIYEVSFN